MKSEESSPTPEYEDSLEQSLATLPDYYSENFEGPNTAHHLEFQRGYRCEICYSLPGSESAMMRSCEKCAAVTCRTCFKFWLETKIFSSQGSVGLRCISCTEDVCDSEVLDLCGERTHKKLLYFRSRAELRSDHSALWCPQDGCWRLLRSNVQIDSSTPKSMPELICCPDCRVEICAGCGAPEHGDEQCKIPKTEVRKETRAKLWTRLHTKNCPECSTPIQRTGGCKHMRCAVCSKNFCWVCKGGLQDFQAPETKGRMCICDRVSGVLFWSTFGVLGVVVLPVVGAAVVCASPPAVIWYATASRDKRERARSRVRMLFVSL